MHKSKRKLAHLWAKFSLLSQRRAQCGVCAIFYILRLAAARGKCQNAKRFMLIFTQEQRGMPAQQISTSSGKLSQSFLSARQCVGKCLFRIRPSVIYGPITFNFTCGPPRAACKLLAHFHAGHVRGKKEKKKNLQKKINCKETRLIHTGRKCQLKPQQLFNKC